MTPLALLREMERLFAKDGSYDRRIAVATISGETSAQDRCACRFSLTGAIEHAACSKSGGGLMLSAPTPAAVRTMIDLKAYLCRRLQAIHLDAWEIATKPDIDDVRTIVRNAIAALAADPLTFEPS